MDRKDYPIRILKQGEEESDTYLENTTAEERLLMMWPLTVRAWAFMGEDIRESRLSRHAVRILRRKR